ncbi:TRAP transporter substrate-binding protein [Marinomonas foliarum]|jgi:TRAP-type transport system periplasmic protein|uniref:Tripartite ATP-independent transporter DctP family solute receptor n=1 Tax=Marinomonas foliarum TaxID=491950 RepID=A0A368ZUK0_9GAMM|nr:TRAP transporter substrate-binding protein [Marinomonas foliarum]RCW99997.1 tripartite ATP-independent transporter DctP family solute receptor [Marinomonas foliarum]
MNLIAKNFIYISVTAAFSSTALANTIVFAHGANPGNPRYEAAEMFAKLVPICTSGQFNVQVAPSATMGDDAEQLISAQAGIINMSANSQGTTAQIVPEVGTLGLPFLFKSETDVWRVLDGEIGQELDRKAQSSGLKIVTFWDNGFRNVTHTKKSIRTPDDIKGMKIRTPPDEVALDIFATLGANPAPLAWSELPTSLRSGAFDGQENPLTNIYSAKIHEITPYISMTGHQYQSTPVVAGLAWWESLDSKTQDCISTSAKQAGWFQRGRNMFEVERLKTVLKSEGAIITEVDYDAFVKATAPVYEKYETQYGDFLRKLKLASEQ